MVRINRTNVQAAIPGFRAIMESIARRDSLMTKQRILREICGQPRIVGRHFHSEIKYVTMYDISTLEREIEALAKECRELDTRIRKANWTMELTDQRLMPVTVVVTWTKTRQHRFSSLPNNVHSYLATFSRSR